VGLRHSALGRFLTVGTGGTGAGRGSAALTVLLPASRTTLEAAAAPFLGAARPADPGAVAALDLLERLCAEFETGALTGYHTVEVNPLFVSPERTAIADVLLVPA